MKEAKLVTIRIGHINQTGSIVSFKLDNKEVARARCIVLGRAGSGQRTQLTLVSCVRLFI